MAKSKDTLKRETQASGPPFSVKLDSVKNYESSVLTLMHEIAVTQHLKKLERDDSPGFPSSSDPVIRASRTL
jgi:hypothetical protein